MLWTRILVWKLAVIAAVLVLARPVAAVEVPEKSVADDTKLMLWLDLKMVDAEAIAKVGDTLGGLADSEMLEEQGVGLPLGDLEESVTKLIEARDALVEAGAEGLVLMLSLSEEDSWSPMVQVLVKTAEGTDAAALAGVVAGLTEELEEDGAAATVEAAPYAKGWHSLSMSMAGGEAVTSPVVTDGDAKISEAFNLQLKEHEGTPFALVFRMDDSIRDMIDSLAINAEDPQTAMLMSVVQQLSGMDTLSLSLADEEGVTVRVAMRFQDQQKATQFMQMYNAIMMMAPALIAQQAQNMENAPKPETINSFFAKLLMQPEGQTLRLKLDSKFFDLAEELGPLFENMGANGQGLDLDL